MRRFPPRLVVFALLSASFIAQTNNRKLNLTDILSLLKTRFEQPLSPPSPQLVSETALRQQL
jgi:hypothetical protein